MKAASVKVVSCCVYDKPKKFCYTNMATIHTCLTVGLIQLFISFYKRAPWLIQFNPDPIRMDFPIFRTSWRLDFCCSSDDRNWKKTIHSRQRLEPDILVGPVISYLSQFYICILCPFIRYLFSSILCLSLTLS